jgi:hypothetical protein
MFFWFWRFEKYFRTKILQVGRPARLAGYICLWDFSEQRQHDMRKNRVLSSDADTRLVFGCNPPCAVGIGNRLGKTEQEEPYSHPPLGSSIPGLMFLDGEAT